MGVELKNNIKQLWWKKFVQKRDDMVGIDAALIMNPKVWEASGHVSTFNDPLIECKNCHHRMRADDIPGLVIETHELGKAQSWNYELLENYVCPNCKKKGTFTNPASFNLMFKTNLGPITDEKSSVYLRPETAQAMFVNFKNILDTSRKQLPFGIAQIGKAFRNEITPGNFIFRQREFEQMEIEYFIPVPKEDADWNKYFEQWQNEMKEWMKEIGLDLNHVHELEVAKEELAHYSKRTIDFEYDFPFGKKELYGLAYRTDFDLQNHMKASGQSLEYTDPQTGEKIVPHVIEPTWGVDRSFLAVLCESYKEEGEGDSKRVYLKLPPKLAPYKVAVFPLLKNKPELVAKAKEIYDELKQHFTVAWDDRGNVGKRYYSQDVIGTPFCITVDFDTIEKDNCVTVRDRDTKEQPRVKIEELVNYIGSNL